MMDSQDAFDNGEWRKISARDRGRLLMKLADLMEQSKEELATIESLDSGTALSTSATCLESVRSWDGCGYGATG